MKTVLRADFIGEIGELLSINRGREVPGMLSFLFVGDLFCRQSKLATLVVLLVMYNERVQMHRIMPYQTNQVPSVMVKGTRACASTYLE